MQITKCTQKEDGKVEQKKKGIICITISAFFFSLMSLFIRLSGDLPVMQKCFFRNVVAMLIAISALKKSGNPIQIGKGNLKYLLCRAVGGTFGLICNFYAIDHISISDASMLNKLSPFFAIICSAFILKEIANKWDWITVITAFFGMMLVIKPSFNVEVIPALLGALGGFGAGFAYTFVRKLGQRGENGMIIVLFFSAFSTLVTLPFFIIQFKPMSLSQWFCLLMTGVAAAGGQIFITKAYSYAPAKEISVYDFSIVVFAALWGFLFLDQIPDLLSVLGYVIIIGSAIVKWYITIIRPMRQRESEAEVRS